MVKASVVFQDGVSWQHADDLLMRRWWLVKVDNICPRICEVMKIFYCLIGCDNVESSAQSHMLIINFKSTKITFLCPICRSADLLFHNGAYSTMRHHFCRKLFDLVPAWAAMCSVACGYLITLFLDVEWVLLTLLSAITGNWLQKF